MCVFAQIARLQCRKARHCRLPEQAGGLGITVSYWKDLESIRSWKAHAEHRQAQANGRKEWYGGYFTRVAKVDYDYDFAREE